MLHYYRYAAGGPAYKFARYPANGALQGVLTTLAAGSPNRSVSPAESNAMELTNGSLVFVDPSSNTSAAVRLHYGPAIFSLRLLRRLGPQAYPTPSASARASWVGFGLRWDGNCKSTTMRAAACGSQY